MENELASRFASLTDEEMLHLGTEYASLTDEAQTLVRAEFSRRNLEVPDAEEEAAPSTEEGVTTIRRFRDQAEALVARGVLESSGIACFLRDENTIRMEWLWSNYMGGIRLQVATRDVEAAEAVLSQPIPAHIAIEGQPVYDQPLCPNCGSLDISFNTNDVKAATVSLYLIGLPLPLVGDKNYWHCNHCATNWTDDSEAP